MSILQDRARVICGSLPRSGRTLVISDIHADLDLLDDRKTAEQIVSSCVRKGYGLARAKQALYEKKMVTYPRTDARVLSTAVSKEIYKNISGLRSIPSMKEYAEQISKCILERGHSVE